MHGPRLHGLCMSPCRLMSGHAPSPITLQVYMILTLAPGGDLMDLVMRRQRYGEQEARRFFQRLLEGLDYCHARCVCVERRAMGGNPSLGC
jgi:serine/threonine protein kinase